MHWKQCGIVAVALSSISVIALPPPKPPLEIYFKYFKLQTSFSFHIFKIPFNHKLLTHRIKNFTCFIYTWKTKLVLDISWTKLIIWKHSNMKFCFKLSEVPLLIKYPSIWHSSSSDQSSAPVSTFKFSPPTHFPDFNPWSESRKISYIKHYCV